MALELAPLPYAYDALNPHMSAETFEFHHDKHLATYVTNANNLLKDSPLADKGIEEIIQAAHKEGNAGIFNNVAQVWNHEEFFKWMSPNGGGAIPGKLEKQIVADFGSVDEFKTAFTQAGATQFGSGWCWLVMGSGGKLEVAKTPNAETPIMNGTPTILGCDVWEHAYYIDYRNRRPDFLKTFVDSLVNWEYAAERFEAAGG